MNPSEQERIDTFNQMETSFSESSKIMKELDEGLVAMVKKLTEDELKLQRKSNRIYNGRVVDITVWEYLTQHIIHQTHHRGQLSHVLDELKVENDFGNIFPYVKDSLSAGM